MLSGLILKKNNIKKMYKTEGVPITLIEVIFELQVLAMLTFL